jgi:hypothetical protein
LPCSAPVAALGSSSESELVKHVAPRSPASGPRADFRRESRRSAGLGQLEKTRKNTVGKRSPSR